MAPYSFTVASASPMASGSGGAGDTCVATSSGAGTCPTFEVTPSPGVDVTTSEVPGAALAEETVVLLEG